ncbi:MAG TPA: acyl transferase [Chitinophagales bacterium]|nr:acyl transferase [Chitinophagales bacterium]HRK28071.1 acyl transferase [Chitinophagales bacterium]
MFKAELFKQAIFKANAANFEQLALHLFAYQAEQCSLYAQYLQLLKINPKRVKQLTDIPFLPIQFFKTHTILCPPEVQVQRMFTSSGTTGTVTSCHYVHDTTLYEQSFTRGFEHFYGSAANFCLLALLPAYMERTGSSLVYMARHLINQSGNPLSGFYLYDYKKLSQTLQLLNQGGQKTLLLGVSFALWDLAEQYPQPLPHTVIMETGGMKGKRPEIVRQQLHHILSEAFGVAHIHSEYGMTELLSQAYSKGSGIYQPVPWLHAATRQINDPFEPAQYGETGQLCFIDLANIHSCAFIATQDVGRTFSDSSFEVLGRFDNSDVRGCNLMV